MECKWTECSNQMTQGSRMDKKTKPSICCLQETDFRPEDTFRLKVKEWRNFYHAALGQKKGGVAILISDKLDFKGSNKR